MKRIYKRIEVASSEILLTLALFSDVGGAESVDAADLDRLEAQLSRPNYTGAEQLLVANVQRSHLEITNEGEVLAVLHRLKRGENIFVFKARYGTNISVQFTIDFVVTDPNETTPVEISEDVVLVESIGDGGGGGGEFPTDYAKQGTNPDATLTDTQAYAQSAASDAGAAKTAADAAKDAAQAIVIPSDYSKQGTDPTATNSAILAAVQSISDIESDVQAGRQALATNITAKGVPTSTSDALVTMATKVLQIPQQLNTGISEFEQMIAPSPYMWNVYTVATDLMKETLPQYIPSYMSSGIYVQYRANNAFFVGEYYLGYDTLELTGADGYLTCDGHFYTITGEVGSRIVTHTLPDGTVETYAAESIVHTWTDGASGYSNRWVGFFYLTNAYSFSNTNESICPRRVALCGDCISFVISGNNRLTDVWVIGSLGHFGGGLSGGSWNTAQVIRGYESHSGADIMYAGVKLTSLVLPDLETVSGRIFTAASALNQNYCANYICMPKLKTLTTNALIVLGGGASGAIYISLPALTSINVPIETFYTQNSGGGDSLVELNVPSLETINITSNGGGFNEPLGRALLSGYISCFSGLKKIDIRSLKSVTSGYVINTYHYSTNNCFASLIDVIVGEMTTHLYMRAWTATNIIADATKKAQLIENIKNHILDRVSDRTDISQLTFTVSTNMFSVIASENIEWRGSTMTLADAFLTKNWLLAGA